MVSAIATLSLNRLNEAIARLSSSTNGFAILLFLDILFISAWLTFRPDRFFELAARIGTLLALPCGLDVLLLKSDFPTMEFLIAAAILATIAVVAVTVKRFRTLFVPILRQTINVY